jgi:1-deoxy-D-xylulose-5-phosphate reductoisomerase
MRMMASAPRSVTLLGATGSIGRSTLDVLARHPARFRVEALAAGRNAEAVAAAARTCGARFAAVADSQAYGALKDALAGSGIACGAGPEAVIEAAERPSEMVVAAIMGAAGLEPTLAAVRRGAMIALANKECLVSAGALFMSEVRRAGATVLPVDSEHNAVFQVFEDEARGSIIDVVLTASGGPFRTSTLEEMAQAKPEQALKHPNWRMGAKITIDSATLMNKGLELIEAHHLFAMDPSQLTVLVHPQSIIHGLVRYADGSVLAELASPDMRVPITNCLAWPERITGPAALLDLSQIGTLTFETPDPHRFPALPLAREALQQGRGFPTALNAANEVAVAAFLEGRIGFLDIARVVEDSLRDLNRHGACDTPDSLDLVRALDYEARQIAESLLRRGAVTVS